MATNFRDYYIQVWKTKLSLPQYSSLDARWRSRWDFALEFTPNGSKVIDVACGDGVLGSFLINDKNCEVHGLDVSDYALNIAKEKGIKTGLIDVSGDTFPYDSNMFDIGIMSCSLEHIMDPIHALKETLRVLKRDGIIIITLPNVAHVSNRFWFMLGKTSKDFLHINPGEGIHLQFYNYEDEFEDRVLSQIKNLSIKYKRGDLKNPKKYSSIRRNIYYSLIKIFPNMFAQYTHWILQKEE